MSALGLPAQPVDATLALKSTHVRCDANSGQRRERLNCPLSASSGHWHTGPLGPVGRSINSNYDGTAIAVRRQIG